MKKLQRIEQIPPQEPDIPVPLLLPSNKRRYLILAVAILLFTTLLVILMAAAPAANADTPPNAEDNTNGTQTPSNDAPSLPTDTPNIDDLVATTPDQSPSGDQIDTPTTDTPAQGDGEIGEGNDTEQAPPVIVEQVVLSGSAGLAFRSNGDGTCILEGMGECTDAFLLIPERAPSGDRVVSIAPSAFAGCSTLRAVQLPASLLSIGEGAFGECSSIAQFYVAPGNTAYISVDGVLYNSDGTTLLAYPAGRPTEVATIPAKVTHVEAMAFGTSARLRSIHFEGNLAAWRKITIGDGNEVLYTLPKTFA